MKDKNWTNLFLPAIGAWWDSLCLKAPHWNTNLGDFLLLKAAQEGLSLEQYVAKKGVVAEPIRVDAISVLWMGMGVAYKNFNMVAKQYDEIVEFREYFGERAFFGLFREYIIRATGIQYQKTK